MEGKGSLEDSTRTHTRRPNWSRLGLTLLDSESTWGRVPTWIRVVNPFLGALPSYKISWQFEFYAVIDNGFSLWLQILPRGGFGQN